jgi:1,4-alpha-glucan branching enzyme
MSQGESAGDLAIVLHSHMPYVEGFGTYPFGEEWLFDAVVRSHLPVLEVAERLTMTVTPVLADQLEDAGAGERLREFLVRFRVEAAEADLDQVPPECREACEAELDRYRHALELLDTVGGDPLRAFREAAESGRVELAASAASHAVLPMLATLSGLRLQLDAGIRSHRRRFGWAGGFWLPECAYVPGLEGALGEQGVRWFCVDQSAHRDPLDALTPVATAAGPTALPIDWEAVSWVWSLDGYPSDPAYAQFAGKSLRGIRIWKVGGGAYEPGAAREATRRQADEFLAATAARLREFSSARGRRGLMVFAIDTELLGHWWSEGADWLGEVVARADSAGVRLLSASEALAEHDGEGAPLEASTWGEGKDLRTWDSAPVADLAWGARRLELRLLRALSRGLRGPAAMRAARELLATQASDWAFLDRRGEAGDYAFRRATDHAEAALEAIDSGSATDPHMRSLAPDLSISALLQP